MNFPHFRYSIYCLCAVFLSLPACRVTYQSAYQANKKDIAINIKEHNLGYMYPQDTSVFNSINLDKFDYTFLNQTNYQIYLAGFSDNDHGSMGKIVLKDCVIDFKFLPPGELFYNQDTLLLNYLEANLICKQDNNKELFYSSAYLHENYQAIALSEPYKLPERFTKNDWVINKSIAYKHKGFNEESFMKLADELAFHTADKFDTLALENFHQEHPALASKVSTTRHVNTKVFALLLIAIFVVLINI